MEPKDLFLSKKPPFGICSFVVLSGDVLASGLSSGGAGGSSCDVLGGGGLGGACVGGGHGGGCEGGRGGGHGGGCEGGGGGRHGGGCVGGS